MQVHDGSNYLNCQHGFNVKIFSNSSSYRCPQSLHFNANSTCPAENMNQHYILVHLVRVRASVYPRTFQYSQLKTMAGLRRMPHDL